MHGLPSLSPRIYNPLARMSAANAALGSTQRSSEDVAAGDAASQGGLLKSGDKALTLTVLRQELRAALDTHEQKLVTRIRQEVNFKDVHAPVDEIRIMRSAASSNRRATDSSELWGTVDEPEMMCFKSTLRDSSMVLKPHPWTQRNPPQFLAGEESMRNLPSWRQDGAAKRPFRAFQLSEITRSTGTQSARRTQSTPPRPRTAPSGILSRGRSSTYSSAIPRLSDDEQGGPRSERRRSLLRHVQIESEEDEVMVLADSESNCEEPPDEIPQKSEANRSVVPRTMEYFEEELLNPMPSSQCPSFRVSSGCLKHRLKQVVESGAFEYTCGIFVVLNAMCLGLETNFQVTHESNTLPRVFGTIEATFCLLFTLEQVMRLCVYRGRFFTMKGCHWNIFDFVVVGLQLFEQISHLVSMLSVRLDLSVVRMLRVLRLVRITRLIRVLRMVHELRTLVASIMGSFKSLGWTLLLLMIVIYTFSVLFTQIVLDILPNEPPRGEALERWFGSLARTALTLFESILGGVSWEEVLKPLGTDVSPWVVALFCFYVAFCVFALMNVVTGKFVEKAMQTAQDHKDMYLANKISEIFFTNEGDHITWEVFARKMDNPDMRDYFKAINVDPSEAFGLFKLLDADGSGDIDCEEIVNGLLRLKGNARALELSLLTSETMKMQQMLVKSMEDVDRHLFVLTRLTLKARSHLSTASSGAQGGESHDLVHARKGTSDLFAK